MDGGIFVRFFAFTMNGPTHHSEFYTGLIYASFCQTYISGFVYSVPSSIKDPIYYLDHIPKISLLCINTCFALSSQHA